jgi:hypothetical protein
MFKLSIQFTTLAALSAFVTKMGEDVMTGTISHDQPVLDGGGFAPESAPAKAPASRSRSKKTTEAAPSAPNVPASTTPAAPFPGGFTPGGAPSAAPQLVHSAPAVGPASQPVVAPVAQAPVAAPAPAPVAQPVQVSPERQALNNNFAQLLQYLEQGGVARGYTPEQLGGVISGSLQQAGIQPGTKITEMNDAQANALYPVLYANVLAAVPQQA